MQYKGNKFKDLLSVIVARRENVPVANVNVVDYFHFADNTLQVTYNYKAHGKVIGNERRLGLLEILEYKMNYA